MKTLADALPEAQERARKILARYKLLGPCGMFGAMMIERDLRYADEAVMSGDVVAMLKALETLQNIKD